MVTLQRAILDTSILVSPHLGTPRIPLDMYSCSISSLSYAEMGFGVLVARHDDRARRQLRMEEVRDVFRKGQPVTDRTAASYSLLFSLLWKQGKRSRARSIDVLIAACAHELQATLLTLNPKDVEALSSEISIVNPLLVASG